MGWHDMDGSDWIWMTIMMVLFWGTVATVIIVLIRRGGTADGPRRETPEETLNHRLTRGEIEIDDYQQRLDALHDSRKR